MQSGETMSRFDRGAMPITTERVDAALAIAEERFPGIVARADSALVDHERRARLLRCPRGDGCRSAVCTEHAERLGSAKDGF